MDREGQRAEYAAWLRAAAEQRFGAARAQELAQATFPVVADQAPAFYAEPEPSP